MRFVRDGSEAAGWEGLPCGSGATERRMAMTDVVHGTIKRGREAHESLQVACSNGVLLYGSPAVLRYELEVPTITQKRALYGVMGRAMRYLVTRLPAYLSAVCAVPGGRGIIGRNIGGLRTIPAPVYAVHGAPRPPPLLCTLGAPPHGRVPYSFSPPPPVVSLLLFESIHAKLEGLCNCGSG